MAFRYLSWIFFPLVVSYACYLLMYHEQKGWYSFCLSTIYGFLLTFGKELIQQISNKNIFCLLRFYYDDSAIIY
jgi:hypothetical protein